MLTEFAATMTVGVTGSVALIGLLVPSGDTAKTDTSYQALGCRPESETLVVPAVTEEVTVTARRVASLNL